jgi:hypothetical protein
MNDKIIEQFKRYKYDGRKYVSTPSPPSNFIKIRLRTGTIALVNETPLNFKNLIKNSSGLCFRHFIAKKNKIFVLKEVAQFTRPVVDGQTSFGYCDLSGVGEDRKNVPAKVGLVVFETCSCAGSDQCVDGQCYYYAVINSIATSETDTSGSDTVETHDRKSDTHESNICEAEIVLYNLYHQ